LIISAILSDSGRLWSENQVKKLHTTSWFLRMKDWGSWPRRHMIGVERDTTRPEALTSYSLTISLFRKYGFLRKKNLNLQPVRGCLSSFTSKLVYSLDGLHHERPYRQLHPPHKGVLRKYGPVGLHQLHHNYNGLQEQQEWVLE